MNAVEIEEAVSRLAASPFDAEEFPYAFLEAYGNRPATIKQLREGQANKSEVGGLLQRNNIHIKVAPEGKAADTLDVLVDDPGTKKAKARFALATDGVEVHAVDLITEEVHIFDYADFPEYFGEFLPLAGIHVVQHVKESSIDVKATRRLNQIYTDLTKHNPDWGTDTLRREMNQFMARLIFCLFAEDTNIFTVENLFTKTIGKISAQDSSNTHEVISDIFNAMSLSRKDRPERLKKSWIDPFPHVNGWLFTDEVRVPRFSRIARSYLLRVGQLDWKKINPDIFGSMIQAITDDSERGSLGAHYTSVPNILKVLQPLFLDDLYRDLEAAGTDRRKLEKLRRRLSRIRVFDPACGSGNFLVIAYKVMRDIEAEACEKMGESKMKSAIPLTNFRGIEIGDFSAEVARLALVIAEYQCNVGFRGHTLAMEEFLPLDATNWIVCGNALRIDWLSVCPPSGITVDHKEETLSFEKNTNIEVNFDNEGGEVFICGNPPYLGARRQSKEHKSDLAHVFGNRIRNWKTLDYVAGWFVKASDFGAKALSKTAFVSTNSICQGEQVAAVWPLIYDSGHEIMFAYESFKWSNLAANKAMVFVVIVGFARVSSTTKRIYSVAQDGNTLMRQCENINAYLINSPNIIVHARRDVLSGLDFMYSGNMPRDDGNLIFSTSEMKKLLQAHPSAKKIFKRFVGAKELIHGGERWCLWITDEHVDAARGIPPIDERINRVEAARRSSQAKSTRDSAEYPHRFVQIPGEAQMNSIVVPVTSSENREYLPVDLVDHNTKLSNLCFGLYDAPLYNLAIIASKLFLSWIGTVCSRLGTGYRFSNTLGWNTFPLPKLTEKNKADLTQNAEDILIAREWHFPATIAELYAPGAMPDNLCRIHDWNDEVVERIFAGRRFRNDTDRLEVLFDRYARMTGEKKS